MNPRHPLVALLVSASLFGCTTSTEHGISIPLTATRHNAGQIGNTTLANWEQQTGFDFFISGVPTGTSCPCASTPSSIRAVASSPARWPTR